MLLLLFLERHFPSLQWSVLAKINYSFPKRFAQFGIAHLGLQEIATRIDLVKTKSLFNNGKTKP